MPANPPDFGRHQISLWLSKGDEENLTDDVRDELQQLLESNLGGEALVATPELEQCQNSTESAPS